MFIAIQDGKNQKKNFFREILFLFRKNIFFSKFSITLAKFFGKTRLFISGDLSKNYISIPKNRVFHGFSVFRGFGHV